MTDKIEEKVTHGKNYTLSLPNAQNDTSFFAVYYDRLRSLAADFAEEDESRVRSYKSRYSMTENGGSITLEVTLTARIKERGKLSEVRARVLRDVWQNGSLVSHFSEEK